MKQSSLDWVQRMTEGNVPVDGWVVGRLLAERKLLLEAAKQVAKESNHALCPACHDTLDKALAFAEAAGPGGL